MAEKIPLKAIYTGSDATALGEFETGDSINPGLLTGAATAPNGNVLTADGVGGASFLPATGGSGGSANLGELAVSNWTARTSAADNSWLSVCWSPELGLFCAVATSGTGNRVMTSPDGINWTARTSAADNDWRSVCWSPELGLFCAVAYSGTGNRVMTSLYLPSST